VPDLVLLRHGESTWNAENRFTGWTDVDLTSQGEDEARSAGRLLASETGLDLRVLHTSLLTRAVRTANLALDELGRPWLPVRRHWRLNERHYGDLTGRNKRETAARFGEEQVKAWRRGYATPPPPVDPSDERHPSNDPRYRDVPPGELPGTESLADVVRRLVPYLVDAIVPDLRASGGVLVVAHGNSLRALAMHLEGIPEEEIVDLDIPTGVPRRYRLDDDLEVLEAAYLGDPAAVRKAAEAVARQAG
jgi:2,3-bisphosphoglycerate-dependent phosphoglycerate mutase